MNLGKLTLFVSLLGFGLIQLKAEEVNAFPGPVSFKSPGQNEITWNAFGPLLFNEPSAEKGRVIGFRPFFVQHVDGKGAHEETTLLYPIFYYRTYTDSYEWSLFKLINKTGHTENAPKDYLGFSSTFDLWPVYFSESTGDPATSSCALFPIYGKLNGHLGLECAQFVLFPLYFNLKSEGSETTYLPWPFLRYTRGVEHGFSFWPLYGSIEKPGVYTHTFALWPFIYVNHHTPDERSLKGTKDSSEIGLLPFYSADKKPGYVNINYVWPLFGYSDRTSPVRYHETRYLWPFLVQGRGDEAYVNRFGPVYTHSIIKGLDKTWILWPLYRKEKWVDGDRVQEKTRILFFLASIDEQSSASQLDKEHAFKTTLWPLMSTWNNGAGRVQTQVFSPFEGLFADNPQMRHTWTPLFSVIRFDKASPSESRLSLFWNALTFAENSYAKTTEFNIGPLLHVKLVNGLKKVAILSGLFSVTYDSLNHFTLKGLDFSESKFNVNAVN
jgi:hypothetical protein